MFKSSNYTLTYFGSKCTSKASLGVQIKKYEYKKGDSKKGPSSSNEPFFWQAHASSSVTLILTSFEFMTSRVRSAKRASN